MHRHRPSAHSGTNSGNPSWSVCQISTVRRFRSACPVTLLQSASRIIRTTPPSGCWPGRLDGFGKRVDMFPRPRRSDGRGYDSSSAGRGMPGLIPLDCMANRVDRDRCQVVARDDCLPMRASRSACAVFPRRHWTHHISAGLEPSATSFFVIRARAPCRRCSAQATTNRDLSGEDRTYLQLM